jgi:hypothetical protein
MTQSLKDSLTQVVNYFPASKVTSSNLVRGTWGFLPQLSSPNRDAEEQRLISELQRLSKAGAVADRNNKIIESEVVLLASNTVIQWLLGCKQLVSKLEPSGGQLIKEGYFGKLGKAHVVTDAFLHPDKHFLPDDGFCIFPIPISEFETYLAPKGGVIAEATYHEE